MRYFILLLLASCLLAVDEPKSPGTLIYEKALSENARDASVAFESYWKALEVANAKVIKALEEAKVNLNDPKKGSLSISDRAKAIMEIDEKIKAVKDAAINDLLVENKKKVSQPIAVVPKIKSPSPIVGFKWINIENPGRYLQFYPDGTGKSDGNWPIKWKLKEGNVYEITFINVRPSIVPGDGPFEIGEKGNTATFMRKGTVLENYVK